ncbi:AraC family transcriptional regulator [Parasalinivibrio latis]|uniref:AraC family transcriptional regulator n=1 Tax=Parasalinivibrio latis TaxID=2952610 RepID=UPI0030DF56FB
MPEKVPASEVITLPEEQHHHAHQYHQVVIGLRGQSEFDVQGYGSLVGPGQGCLVSSNSDHAYVGMGNNQILVINLPIDEANHDWHTRMDAMFEQQVYFNLDSQGELLVRALSAEMLASPDDPLLARASADTILCVMQRHFRNPSTVFHRGQRLDLDVVERYILQHLNRKISVAQLAGQCFLGESQFHYLFKQQTGITPHQFVLDRRLKMARELIKEGELTFSQIADSCGFASQSGLTSAFTRSFGMPPSEYRRRHS